MAKISQVRQDVNALLGYAASNQTAFAAAKVFINGRVDLASPNEVTKFIRENVIEAQEFVKGHLSKSATKDVEPKTAPVDAVLPIEAQSYAGSVALLLKKYSSSKILSFFLGEIILWRQ